MSAEKTVTFYLHSKLRRQAQAGNHNFITKLSNVLCSSGLQVAYDDDDDLARLRALSRPGRGLFLMDEPVNSRCLTFRKTYIYPFWHIEKQGKRWEWPVARDLFSRDDVDRVKSQKFYGFWQNRLFKDAIQDIRQDGFVYVPLQGRLTTRRSFQQCSPIDMVKSVLEHDRARYIVTTLHPSENYSKQEQDALEALMNDNDRLYVRAGGTDRYLRHCDYIVTQNSSMGFMGYFLGKPLILFGKIDFHHIALNVQHDGLERAFDAVDNHAPDYAAYMYWFLQHRSINAGRSEAETRIRNVLRRHGWPV